jgi:exopolysaccharide production protein ExoY
VRDTDPFHMEVPSDILEVSANISSLCLQDDRFEAKVRPADALGGYAKRSLDVALAILLLLLLVPLICLIAIAIKLSDGGPILFSHSRVGRGGREFSCLKFRTMVVDSEKVLCRHLAKNSDAAREWRDSHKLRKDPRITWLGAGLRKSSLDELPQLVNILRGEMSFVGPRPIVKAEIPKYGDCMAQYLRARPGLTGLWQVSGRNDIDYERRVRLDRDYIENWSFQRDLAILARTFFVVLRSRGSY